jgi:NAD(P)-dependent dehydrogenase (short-subunit alcohol dehydrogenase family)
MPDKNVLVIGGSSGIGLQVVKSLVDQGEKLHVFSRSSEALQPISGVTHVQWDVLQGDPDFGSLPETLQGLVYCPGSIRLKPIQRLTEADFRQDWQINLLGAVRAIKGCLTRLKKSASGASIVLFSTVAVTAGMPFHASVASAKGAVEGLTRSLAAELAPRIRVNALAPSLTDTPLAADLLSSDEKRQAAAQRNPLKRVGSAKEIAAMARFLLSEDAAWITGQILHVDGGMTALRTFR